jgi:hypothetical protein
LLPRDYPRGRLPLRLSPLPRTSSGSRLPDARLPQFQGCQAPAALRPVAGFPDRRLLWRHRRFPRFTGGFSPPFQGKPLTFMTVDSLRLFRWRLLRRTQAALCGIPNADRVTRWPVETARLEQPVSRQPRRGKDSSRVRSPSPAVLRHSYAGSWPTHVFGQPGTGVTFPVGPNPLQVDSPCNLSVKPRLLAACVGPHGTFQGQLFHHRRSSASSYAPRTQRLPAQAWRYWHTGRSLIPLSRFVTHPAGVI